ncbi:hypothetical protein JYG23_00045 [Sedimentibacter sp. zth1]|uniref:hypothetical protein n=1 Tax=Sedimentibacter sp. zth1 TaxID=2816908 RepID=UPI001A91AB4D|nr:hypothetical protein [Sedimentibacter sp. zth1]QSX05901.1 hypothetical protein JYG23_00045 [Sedimentibacter sp. zth1]
MHKKSNILKILVVFVLIVTVIIISIILINQNKDAKIVEFLSEFLIDTEEFSNRKYHKSCHFEISLIDEKYDCEVYKSSYNPNVINEFIKLIINGGPQKVKNVNKINNNITFSSLDVMVYIYVIDNNDIVKSITLDFDNSQQFYLITYNDSFKNDYILKYELDNDFYKYFIDKYAMKREK